MEKTALKARLKMAGERAALPGETVHPEVIERSGGTATIGVIFKRGKQSAEDVMIHGSWYSEWEKERLLAGVLHGLELRNRRSASR
jgi:hypothetical protein